jgi:dihydrofolate reductase
MTGSPDAPWKVSVPSSSVATCSDLFVENGRTIDGKAGGVTIRPIYHAPTFVLTHYPRPPIEMLGGTTFHFVSDGIEDALQKAREAAGAKDVKIGGGVETVRQYLQAGYVDEIHLAFAPIALGEGESLFNGLDLRALGYRTVEHVPTDRATHIVLAK